MHFVVDSDILENENRLTSPNGYFLLLSVAASSYQADVARVFVVTSKKGLGGSI